ncbi:hypothetical protein Tco_0412731 [Tanacetum coccineum]
MTEYKGYHKGDSGKNSRGKRLSISMVVEAWLNEKEELPLLIYSNGCSTQQDPLHEHPGCQITRETVTTDQHDELIKMGIKPTFEGVKGTRMSFYGFILMHHPTFLEVQSLDYAGDVSSVPYDRYGGLLDITDLNPLICNYIRIVYTVLH